MDSTRREFLKKGAAAGALTWAAPAILSLPAGRAWAQPSPVGDCPCTAAAFGLRVIIPALSIDEFFGVGECEAEVARGAPGVAVAASVVCSTADSDGSDGLCVADASVAVLSVVVGNPLAPDLTVSASVLTSRARVSCEPCGTAGSSNVAGLTVNSVGVEVSGACNFDVGDLGFVIVNEQTCGADGTISVNALHIRAPLGVAEVIVAHTEAGPSDCPCHTCF